MFQVDSILAHKTKVRAVRAREEKFMTTKEEKRREQLLRRLQQVEVKIMRLKKVLARLQAHLAAVKPKKTAAA